MICNTESVRCWNRIGNTLRNSPNFKLFKTRLISAYRSAPKSIFGIQSGIKPLFQLRACLSPFSEHKMNHNFLDTSSNGCTTYNLSENLEHFFLYCTRSSGGFQILGHWAIFYMRGPACERREQLGVWGAVWGGGAENF